MNVEILAITKDAELLIEQAGRTCYMSFDKITEESAGRFIRSLIKSGHESVLEHASVTFRISGISRALSHQLVRHRIASYSQKSQRYCKEGSFDFVTPPDIVVNHLIKHDSCEFIKDADTLFADLMKQIQLTYDTLIQLGIKPEDARFVLPNACTTEIVVTMNFRTLRHFLHERLSPRAQWEIRLMATNMYDLVQVQAPNCFYDIVKTL